MIHTQIYDLQPYGIQHYATIQCERQDCGECICFISRASFDHALDGAHTEAITDGWTLDGDRHYCPEHKPVVIDANQMELLP